MTEDKAILEQQQVADLNAVGGLAPDDGFQLSEDEAAASLEALLFAAGDPLPLEKIQQITGLERQALQLQLDWLAVRMANDRRRGLLLRVVEGRYFLCTKPEMKAVLQRLFQPRQRPPLSQAAYETLAIIAYNQPVTRAQVEAVRGVNSDNIINRLVERNLVKEAGNLDTPGRPLLYETTEQFLMDFGLRSVHELPPMEMLMYGTLRDFESSLEDVSDRSADRQLTIDQLVQAGLPGGAIQAAEKPERPAESAEPMPSETLFAVSTALFGEETAEDDDENKDIRSVDLPTADDGKTGHKEE
jgi:segregation and condensation protein B